jgi:hypothetical protein
MGACVQRKLVVAAALDYWVVEFHLLSRWFLLRWSGRFSTKVAPARWMFFLGGGEWPWPHPTWGWFLRLHRGGTCMCASTHGR